MRGRVVGAGTNYWVVGGGWRPTPPLSLSEPPPTRKVLTTTTFSERAFAAATREMGWLAANPANPSLVGVGANLLPSSASFDNRRRAGLGCWRWASVWPPQKPPTASPSVALPPHRGKAGANGPSLCSGVSWPRSGPRPSHRFGGGTLRGSRPRRQRGSTRSSWSPSRVRRLRPPPTTTRHRTTNTHEIGRNRTHGTRIRRGL